MANRKPLQYPRYQAWANDETFLNGGTITFYDAGTTNKRNVYQDAALTTTAPNPVTLNSRGEPQSAGGTAIDIYLDNQPYKIVLKDSSGTTKHTIDNYIETQDVLEPKDPADATDQSTDVFGGTLNSDPASGETFQVDFQTANTTTTPTFENTSGSLGAKTIKTWDKSPVWSHALKGVHSLYYDGTDYLVIDPHNGIRTVDSLSNLQALVVSNIPDGYTAYLRGRSSLGDGGEGHFRWDSSNLSTEVGNDEVTANEGDGGIYVAPSSDKTGASGAWVRQVLGNVRPEWYGADGSADETALAAAASLEHAVELDGTTYSVDGVITYIDALLKLYGAGWHRDANGDEHGTIIEASATTVTDLLKVQSSSPASLATTDIEQVVIHDLLLKHRGSGVGLLIDNITRSRLANISIRCNNEGAIGLKYDHRAFFSLLEKAYIDGFTTSGVLIDGEGTQHTVKDCHIQAGQASIGLETRRAGTIITGGQINTNPTGGGGVGILFNNKESSGQTRGLVDGVLFETDTGIKITGDTDSFYNVVAQNVFAAIGGGQTVIEFDKAFNCVLLNPMVNGAGGGTTAKWGANANKCGVIGNYDACRGAMDVDASATQSYVICTDHLSSTEWGNLTTDSNLTVIAESVENIGRAVHNGTAWDKYFQSVSDDSAASFVPPTGFGLVKINSGSAKEQGAASFNASGGGMESLYAASDIEVQTGNTTLSGTTGTDGKLVISASSDGNVYVENRLGGNRNVKLVFETQ